MEVISAKIVKRQLNDRNDQFMPATPVPFALVVNEGSALIQNHDAPTREQYKNLLTQPVKGIASAKSLKAILDNIEDLRDHFVDILVVVTFVSIAISAIFVLSSSTCVYNYYRSRMRAT